MDSYLQIGSASINCEAEISKDEFVENYKAACVSISKDINEAYKEYSKMHNKLKPKPTKKKKKEDSED